MEYIIKELSRNKIIFQKLFSELQKEEFLWKPAPEKWCLLEIICHLYDEEREDFRARTKYILESKEGSWPSIDPVGWVKERKYMEQEFSQKLQAFLEEREQSVVWLRSLENPNWKKSYNHPNFGSMSAEMFLNNWLAHDYLHIRQIIRTKYFYLEQKYGQNLDYAGGW